MTELTSTIIAAVGGDPTARGAGEANAAAIAQLQAQVQALQAAVRTVSFTNAKYSVNEGPSGVTTNLTAIMKRTGDLSAPLAVTTKFIAGTLDASDFASGTLPGDLIFNFAANSDSAQAFDVIKGDDVVEPAESMGRALVPPPGYSFGAITSYTGDVLNDDTATKITINGTPPTTGKVGTAYSFTPTTANGSGTKTFTLSSGTLLGGLSFSTTTGAITGTPTVAGTMSGLVITVADSTGSASTTPTSVTIAAATTPVSISGTPPTTGTVGTAYVYAPATANGSGTKTFALSGGPLLSGLTFSTTTGGISGTPTVAGSMPNLIITVTDSSGSASTTATTVTISTVAAGTARSYGPTAIADSGWQEMGPLDQVAHFEANNASYTGTFSEGFTIFLGCDTNDGSPNIGLKFDSFGNSQYTQCYYRSGGAWVAFTNNRGGVNWGRELLISDKVDVAFENGSTVATCRLNGVAFPSPGADGTVSSSNFSLAFPNGPGKFARVLRTGGNTGVTDGWSTKLTGRAAA